MPVVASLAASEDPATAEALRRSRRRGRALLVGGAVLAPLVWAVAAGLAAAGAEAVAGVVGLVGLLLVPAVVLLAATQPIREKDLRLLARALASPWQRVEVIALVRAPADPTRPVVVVLDPATGEPAGTWLVAMIRSQRWLVPDERQWAYLAVADDGEDAVLAPLDRSRFAILRSHAGPGSPAVHEWAWTTARERFDLAPPAAANRAPAGPAVPLGTHVGEHEPRRWPNRPMTGRARLLLMAALVVGATIITLGSWVVQRDREAHDADLLAEGVRTDAVVLQSHDNGGNPSQIVVEYGTGDGWWYEVRRSVPEPQRPPEGAVVEVAYDPSDPKDMVLVGIDRTGGGALAVLSWCVVVTVGAGLAWRAWRPRRVRRRTARADGVAGHHP